MAFRNLRRPALAFVNDDHAPSKPRQIQRGRQAGGPAADHKAIQNCFETRHRLVPVPENFLGIRGFDLKGVTPAVYFQQRVMAGIRRTTNRITLATGVCNRADGLVERMLDGGATGLPPDRRSQINPGRVPRLGVFIGQVYNVPVRQECSAPVTQHLPAFSQRTSAVGPLGRGAVPHSALRQETS